jgi:hypothetical protein
MSGYWNRPRTARSARSTEKSRRATTGDRVVQEAAATPLHGTGVTTEAAWLPRRLTVEAVLGTPSGVAEVAVIAWGWLGRVSAFVCPETGRRLAAELRAHCALLLPPYMIPDRFLVLTEMPRGDRGKIDYHSLGRMERSHT